MNNQPTTEDRIWAVLSHLSALTFGIGILLPIVGWSDQRRKSNYASFQCLQALGYQSLGYTVWFLAYSLLVLVFVVIMLVALGFPGEGSNNNPNAILGIWMSILLLIVFGMFGIYFFLPVIAAVSCALGKDFRYPIMGNRLANYLGYNPAQAGEEQTWLIEDHEDRWVTAMGHFSVIIILWGMLASLTAWILQGKRNLFLKFQSIQTFVYQAGVTLLIIGTGLIYMIGFFVFIVMIAFGENYSALNSSPGIGGLVFIIMSMLGVLVFVLVVPLFHILGQWAGYRVLKGDNYRYPLVGGLVDRWVSNTTMLKPPSSAARTPPKA